MGASTSSCSEFPEFRRSLEVPVSLGSKDGCLDDLVCPSSSSEYCFRDTPCVSGIVLGDPRLVLTSATLNAYHLSENSGVWNGVLHSVGFGLYHCGVEVFGREWSFNDTSELPWPECAGSGVYSCKPRRSPGQVYFRSVPLGQTVASEAQVMAIIALLEKRWKGADYDLLRKNCHHFCNYFCRMLGVRPVPPWVMNATDAGEKYLDCRGNAASAEKATEQRTTAATLLDAAGRPANAKEASGVGEVQPETRAVGGAKLPRRNLISS
mmetsp:Transcript_36027/g.78569  ORF Transcript_36027/g.78569 Transcript_36027/m.78569 type:complete len:266 (+) Transcript_36027:62-859(+)